MSLFQHNFTKLIVLLWGVRKMWRISTSSDPQRRPKPSAVCCACPVTWWHRCLLRHSSSQGLQLCSSASLSLSQPHCASSLSNPRTSVFIAVLFFPFRWGSSQSKIKIKSNRCKEAEKPKRSPEPQSCHLNWKETTVSAPRGTTQLPPGITRLRPKYDRFIIPGRFHKHRKDFYFIMYQN